MKVTFNKTHGFFRYDKRIVECKQNQVLHHRLIFKLLDLVKLFRVFNFKFIKNH